MRYDIGVITYNPLILNPITFDPSTSIPGHPSIYTPQKKQIKLNHESPFRPPFVFEPNAGQAPC